MILLGARAYPDCPRCDERSMRRRGKFENDAGAAALRPSAAAPSAGARGSAPALGGARGRHLPARGVAGVRRALQKDALKHEQRGDHRARRRAEDAFDANAREEISASVEEQWRARFVGEDNDFTSVTAGHLTTVAASTHADPGAVSSEAAL